MPGVAVLDKICEEIKHVTVSRSPTSEGVNLGVANHDLMKMVITLTFAQSLDGSITAQRGMPTTISSPESMQMTHQLRAAHAGIMVGVGTVLADNPSLTTRLASGTSPQPIIIDSKLQTPLECKLFTDERCELKPWLFHLEPSICCTSEQEIEQFNKRLANLTAVGARCICVEANNGHVNLSRVFQFLDKEIDSLMIEGGAAIITSALSDHAVCSRIRRIVITIAPLFLGGLCSIQGSIPSELQRHWKMETSMVLGGDIVASLVQHIYPNDRTSA